MWRFNRRFLVNFLLESTVAASKYNIALNVSLYDIRIQSLVADNTRGEDMLKLVKFVTDHEDKVDVLVNNPWKDSEDPSDPWANPRDGNFLKHLTLAPGLDPVVAPVASDEMLLRFVQSRTNPQLRDVARLSHVVAEFDRPMDSDILPDLQDAIAAGLIISLSHHTVQSSSIHSYSPLEGTDDFAGGGAAEGC
ncbi:hypothetical protein B0H13DRAFT_1850754 [Mycena leptocephala]|nr:hypothetical protein B0H13DRAFT_1850754 [Mycena leptocephala]